MSQYAERDTDLIQDSYSIHVEAMTREGLHSKSAIAAELAWRDMRIGASKLEGMVIVRDQVLAGIDVALSGENTVLGEEATREFQDFRAHVVDLFGDYRE